MKKIMMITAIMMVTISSHAQLQSSCTWDVEVTNNATHQVVHYNPSVYSATTIPINSLWQCGASKIDINIASDHSVSESVILTCSPKDPQILGKTGLIAVVSTCLTYPVKSSNSANLSLMTFSNMSYYITVGCITH